MKEIRTWAIFILLLRFADTKSFVIIFEKFFSSQGT